MGYVRKPFYLLLTGFMAIMLAASFAFAEDLENVEVEGYAVIVDGKMDIAREKAISNAFRRAVEQAVGVMVESTTLVSSFELLDDNIYANSSGYIKRYDIVGERIEGDSCRIRLKAAVSLVKLGRGLDSIGVLSKKMGKPRIALFLSEQNADQAAPSYWWGGEGGESTGLAENMIMNRFRQDGFEFVDRRVVLASLRDGKGATGPGASLSNDAALKLMAAGEAEVVIIGQAQARQGVAAIAGTSMRSCQATVSLRAVNADSGELLASFTGSAVAAHVNPAAGGAEALKKAAGEAADKLIGQITASWKKTIDGQRTVKLIVSDLGFDDVPALKQMLKERINRIDAIYERSFTDGKVKLDMDVAANARDIARELNNSELKGGTLKVTSVTANVIQLTINRKR